MEDDESQQSLSHRDVTRFDSRELVLVFMFTKQYFRTTGGQRGWVTVRLLSRPSNAKSLDFFPVRLLSSKQRLSRRLCIYVLIRTGT